MKSLLLIIALLLAGCSAQVYQTKTSSEPELLRLKYRSDVDNSHRAFFVYLPKNYRSENKKQWPVMLFLHGNGERGNGNDELGHVLKHGPLYEAWIQKKDLPFIIIAPQLHMFDFDKQGIDYIDNRSNASIPKRLKQGTPQRPLPFATSGRLTGVSEFNMSNQDTLFPNGWEQVENDLIAMLNRVQSEYRIDKSKTYLTGLSYGGVGTWYLASQHPQRFAAIAPVVGWGHPLLMPNIAKHKLPIWAFAGGRDSAVEVKYFYHGLNQLEKLGHKVRFTVHEDMGHDAWVRVYQGQDIYDWLLQHSLGNN